MSPQAKIIDLEARGLSTRLFLILPADQVPDNALVWTSNRKKADMLRAWRRAVCVTFPESTRMIRTAWVLCELFHLKGYSFASDPYLAREAGLAVNKLQDTLLGLHKGGAIIRVHTAGKLEERRIYPARTLMPAHPGPGVSTTPRQPGGQNKRTTISFRKTQTMRDSQRWAERNRVREESLE